MDLFLFDYIQFKEMIFKFAGCFLSKTTPVSEMSIVIQLNTIL